MATVEAEEDDIGERGEGEELERGRRWEREAAAAGTLLLFVIVVVVVADTDSNGVVFNADVFVVVAIVAAAPAAPVFLPDIVHRQRYVACRARNKLRAMRIRNMEETNSKEEERIKRSFFAGGGGGGGLVKEEKKMREKKTKPEREEKNHFSSVEFFAASPSPNIEKRKKLFPW